jgi:phospholipid/cholesterol/gamma-HCH transport system substrate-binding protein
MRRIILVAMTVLGLAVLLLTFTKRSGHQFEVKSCFQDARGLRVGAPVRVAGVEVGRVEAVRVRPELKEHAAEVVLHFQTPYKLEIPSDSVVSLNSDGLLGERYVEIDVRHASGRPVGSQAVLKAREEVEQPKGERQDGPAATAPAEDGSLRAH